jgi:integrase
MALKNSYVTSDRLEWETATNLVRKLYRDGDYRMSLLIGCGIFFGLRISDLRQLTWAMLLNDDKFIINEQKTGKRREVTINRQFQQHVKDCAEALTITEFSEHCFISHKKAVYSTQRINVLLKQIKQRYNLKIEHFSTHSLRKTFGYRIYTSSGDNAEVALVKLMELFNHSNVAVTKRYLGIRQEELAECYSLLSF